jgi:hypothetical protein
VGGRDCHCPLGHLRPEKGDLGHLVANQHHADRVPNLRVVLFSDWHIHKILHVDGDTGTAADQWWAGHGYPPVAGRLPGAEASGF